MHLVVSEDLRAQPACAAAAPANDPEIGDPFDDGKPIHWSVDDIVKLHMVLLDELARLADPVTPLEEKLDLLQWVYTEPECDGRPFSFANCIKLCGQSINPHYGLMSAEDVRVELSRYVPRWLQESLSLYPEWLQQAVRSNPQWVWARLEENPQFINQQAKRAAKQGDLFS
ncbi:MAG TPA: hypothetical protein PKV98_17400 [Burkholderiaceae bacterium]|nr:hypothetical protein [Burkholderiaceae bacterium]